MTSPAKRVAAKGYTRHLVNRLGSYCIVSKRLQNVRLLQDKTENTASINYITNASGAKDSDEDVVASKGSRESNKGRPLEAKKERRKEYTGERRVGHKRTRNKIR